MIKRLFATVLLVMAFALPARAADVQGVYAGLKFIDSINSSYSSGDSSDVFGNYTQNTIGGGIFVGYDFYPQSQVPIRAELEYAIRSKSTQSDTWNYGTGYLNGDRDFYVQTLMANFYYDFHNSSAFTPYIGAGLGIGFIDNHVSVNGWNSNGNSFAKDVSQVNTVFAWNAGVGVAYAINENCALDLAYRFVGLGENSLEIYGMNYNNTPYLNEFTLAFRYTF